ncbi:MAG: hypothetical protein ACOYOU_18335 [Kiritimatiellia bacterium]
MNRIIATLAVVCLCGAGAVAAPVKLTIASVSTNASPIASDVYTNDAVFLSGYVNAVTLDLGSPDYSSPTCTVFVATVGDTGSGPSRILYAGRVARDVVLPVRMSACGTNGTDISASQARIPLEQDRIVAKAYALNNTNATSMTVWVDVVASPY